MTFELPEVPPGLRRLTRRLATYDEFLAELVGEVERTVVDGRPLGRDWDVEGDPRAMKLARLWAYVAEGVAAYTELTAGEAYLPTAQDWTDLRRVAALVGHQPRQRVAAQGWVKVDTDRGASPLVVAGTRVQAPAAPGRSAQVFEVAQDTQLWPDWAGLTATPVPAPATPTGASLRFLQDPGFRVGDRVLFVEEKMPTGPIPPPPWAQEWSVWWHWLMYWWYQYIAAIAVDATPLAVAKVRRRVDDLGTVLVTFDRELGPLLSDPAKAYAAYRVVAAAGTARRQTSAVRIPATGAANTVGLQGFYSGPPGAERQAIVLDTQLDQLSSGQRVAVVDWGVSAATTASAIDRPGCDIAEPSGHFRLDWEVAPGSSVPASRLTFNRDLGTLVRAQNGRPMRVYVVGPRIPAQHYAFPPAVTAASGRIRLYPAPAAEHPVARFAMRDTDGVWNLLTCTHAPASAQERPPVSDGPPPPRGLIVDLTATTFPLAVDRAPASANVVRVVHGASTTSTLGSGDATRPGQRLPVPKAPVAADITADGTPASTLEVRVDGRRWEERPTLFGAGAADVYTTVLGPDGAQTVVSGDGLQGNRFGTGRNNVTARYRVGGGTEGELPAGAITSLLGSVRGVKGVAGAGPTTGGADQDDPRRLRTVAPGRARAGDRAVSRGDLADLALAFPGVSHAVAWRGAGPPGCACAASGEHLAFLRLGVAGPRVPDTVETRTLAAFLDGRRDVTVPLCVTGATVTALSLAVTVVADPALRPADVAAAVTAALSAPDGPLNPLDRALGVPLDRSDVMVVVHGAPGVVGVPVLTLGTAPPTRRHELTVVAPNPTITAVTA